MREKYTQQELDDIIKHTDPEMVLDYYGVEGYCSESQFIGLCPFHDDTRNSFGVSLDTGLWNCFTCDKYGNMFQFIQNKEKISFPKAVETLKNIIGYRSIIGTLSHTESIIKLLNATKEYNKFKKKTNSIKEKIELPEECENAEKYFDIVGKRVTKTMIRKWDIKYAASGRYAGRMIIPIVFNKKLVGWFERDMTGKAIKAKKYNKGAPIGEVFFNWDNATRKNSYVILTEGMLDCMQVDSWGFNCMALLGIQLGLKKKLLLYRNFSKVYIALDNDNKKIKNYAQINAKKIGESLKNEVQTYNILLPVGKDPDECTKEEFIYSLKNAKRF